MSALPPKADIGNVLWPSGSTISLVDVGVFPDVGWLAILKLRDRRILVSVRNLSSLFACFVFLVTALVFHPDRALAQNSAHCDGYARDHAQRNSTGHVSGGAVTGAIGGGLIGGIVGGGGGLAVGALVGAGTGAIVGSDDKSRHYNALYHSAYNNCMRG
jgi:hypothetical protein